MHDDVTGVSLVARASRFASNTGIVAPDGSFSYGELLKGSAAVGAALLGNRTDLEERRVAYLLPAGFSWVATQWGVWRAGGVAVPLAIAHPLPELEYVVADCGATTIIVDEESAPRVAAMAQRLPVRLLDVNAALRQRPRSLPRVVSTRRAQMFYTSGTTGKPKGAVLTHANVAAQVESLVRAWEWSERDYILGALPLHHVHGVINVVACALWSGATCELMLRFDAGEVWHRLVAGGVTLLMGVPTMYARLIAEWERASPEDQARMSHASRTLRLMVSGSAALPVSLLERWREISGHTLLERYGMTEIGMALSNPLRGERLPGHVGAPLPGVEVRLVDDEGRAVKEGTPGEIEVRGRGVFLEYLGRPEATAAAFRRGWFRTGDVAVLEHGSYRILGRQSVDIIKTGGYKVSALEIEEVLRDHPDIADCAVVGVPDAEWGERVCAAVVTRDALVDLAAVTQWARARLAPYKVPSRLRVVSGLPRNVMGKVLKPDVARLFLTRPA
jgi:malonyl-CoA/methylmalonyl-CoA synthetase